MGSKEFEAEYQRIERELSRHSEATATYHGSMISQFRQPGFERQYGIAGQACGGLRFTMMTIDWKKDQPKGNPYD